MTVHTLFQSQTEPAQNRFDEIWQIWPRHEKKPLAKAKYEAILKGLRTRTLDKDSGQFVEIELAATEEEIIAGIKAYLQSQKATGSGNYGYKDGGKFIPYLSTFLNGGRYLDHT